ncbi:NAD-dependent protein deacetylase HST1-like [Cucurbita moschata]|uniref:NAD-dependent protein deacetylase HST1-like n=1 Tax=Cucurbita moschata TaxID=3662 RepID=A0A6J1HIL6_CUCMO|nr:NAD-dependent protein deacetylase HST1-like [Cucurbita moschata]
MSRQTSRLNNPNDASAFHYDESFDYSSVPDAAPNRTMKPQMSRRNSIRVSAMDYTDPTEPDRDNRARHFNFSESRMMSAREAVAAQEAADAAAAAAEATEKDNEQNENNEKEDENENEKEDSTTASEKEKEEEEEEENSPSSEPVRISLMDLLHETDKEMGFGGSNYGMGFGEDFFDDDDDDDEDYYEDEDDGHGREFTCCVCMVKHKNAALAPCGHTFCRLCSKEFMVSRGNCPTCSDFILEILDAF